VKRYRKSQVWYLEAYFSSMAMRTKVAVCVIIEYILSYKIMVDMNWFHGVG